MYAPKSAFPVAFQCYKPTTEKVYGSICMSPNNTVLVVKGRRSNKWSFPKGHKEGCEPYLTCAKRETLEETGIDLESYTAVAYQRLSVGEYYFFELEEEIEPRIQDTQEVSDARWMTIQELQKVSCNVDVNAFISRMKRNTLSFGRRRQ